MLDSLQVVVSNLNLILSKIISTKVVRVNHPSKRPNQYFVPEDMKKISLSISRTESEWWARSKSAQIAQEDNNIETWQWTRQFPVACHKKIYSLISYRVLAFLRINPNKSQ